VSSREIDDEVLTLAASGWTYFTRFVLYDYETESLWFPIESRPELTCVSGTYADRTLAKFGFLVTSWQKWKEAHPNSKYMGSTSLGGSEGCLSEESPGGRD
jgi:hypothetical protein